MKLNDTQLILLTTAARRDNGSLIPLPEALTDAGSARKGITALNKKVMAEEGEVAEPMFSWREENGRLIGVRITDAGRDAIGIGKETGDNKNVLPPPPVQAPSPEKKQTKAGLILAMLQRAEGATLDEMVAATGWLPHTTCAALTGLRKKGHQIDKGKRADATCYTVAAKA